MSIILNGTKLGSRITFNNIDLSKIIFNGTTVWESGPASLEDATWQQISDSIKNGTFSQFASVGDTKSFEINGKTYHAEVVAINDGTGSAGGWYPANTVDFICKELYETEYQFNSTNINAGGFPGSLLRSTLVNTIYPLLPNDLKTVIVDKTHSYVSGSYDTSWDMTTLAIKLWLPTYYEIVGSTEGYTAGETSANNKMYTLESKIKMLNGSNTADFWYLGTPSTYHSTYSLTVDKGGSVCYSNSDSLDGVPICFRIGVPPKSLENTSWQEIKNDIANGTFSQYASVGDTKSFEINGKTYHAEVVSINDGTGDAGQWYPDKTVDFICTELYETTYPYNTLGNNRGGFPSSEVKDTLNDIIYPLFPMDLKNVIIDKSHSYQSGNRNGSSWSSQMTTLDTKLWLPTYYEIVGTTHQYVPGETSSNNKAYTLASKIKNLNGGSDNNWWLGSPYSKNNGTDFWIVYSTGVFRVDSASLLYGLPICFRIG